MKGSKLFFILLTIISSFSLLIDASNVGYQLSLKQFMAKYPQTIAQQCTNNYQYQFQPFPLYPEKRAELYPESVTFADIFIIQAPNSTCYLDDSHYFFINDVFITETQIKSLNFFNNQRAKPLPRMRKLAKVPGKIAIISHLYPYCYGHFILDVLCQLALLEMHDIDYNYLVAPMNYQFAQDALRLWGIDFKKIIHAGPRLHLKADMIIMPTAVTSTVPCITTVNYTIDFLIKYVAQKLLNSALSQQSIETCDKIFISRKDANAKRTVPNEDEIFEIFQKRGFKRYELTKLSLVDQIHLFHHAKEIVSFVGSGSMNLIFSQPGTKYIEITQSMIDPTFFFIANIFDVAYYSINASTMSDLKANPYAQARPLPLDIIHDFLKTYE